MLSAIFDIFNSIQFNSLFQTHQYEYTYSGLTTEIYYNNNLVTT